MGCMAGLSPSHFSSSFRLWVTFVQAVLWDVIHSLSKLLQMFLYRKFNFTSSGHHFCHECPFQCVIIRVLVAKNRNNFWLKDLLDGYQWEGCRAMTGRDKRGRYRQISATKLVCWRMPLRAPLPLENGLPCNYCE